MSTFRLELLAKKVCSVSFVSQFIYIYFILIGKHVRSSLPETGLHRDQYIYFTQIEKHVSSSLPETGLHRDRLEGDL